jgi:hypothetical protein
VAAFEHSEWQVSSIPGGAFPALNATRQFVDRADKVAREIAIDTLLDDVELSLEANDRRMAQATLALVRHLMVVHDISDPELLAWYSELLVRMNDDGIPDVH